MAAASDKMLPALAAALLCCALARVAQCGGGAPQNYTSMFSFGDSLTDTGNLLVSSPLSNHIVGRYPYGMTYFHRPTGRCSDGRLVVDFLAQAFGLPLLPPYLQSKGKDLRRGVNFAVGGATAMDPPFFQEIGASDKLWTNLSLSVQLGWFEQLKPSLCSSPKKCKEYFSKSLFLVGEIGGNDYNYAFFKGKTLDDAKTYVPTVAGAVTDASERLIKAGATHLVVPGNLPMGCSSAYLTLHPGRNGSDYDSAGCLKTYNDFAQHHNAVLQQKLQALRAKYPQARIMYADYYGAAMSFAKNPKQFGFTQGPLRTCCGGGGPYNFNPKASCGVRGSSVCTDPSAYANWDGVHLTEAAYHAIADSILNGPYTSPRLL
ncbi:GDSL esterase/lipase [Panicum miliaceum]|uniref:GDSL esterase/lipase n=1 Tax=Panicum miliaceum TaxID=4540 RepID=A0A3L6QWQ4_PANMI|nr:GDSL esterase/lipase [Panicum miliaceum]